MKINRPIEPASRPHLCGECGHLVSFRAAEVLEDEGRPVVISHGECPQGHKAVLERPLARGLAHGHGRDSTTEAP